MRFINVLLTYLLTYLKSRYCLDVQCTTVDHFDIVCGLLGYGASSLSGRTAAVQMKARPDQTDRRGVINHIS